MEVRECYDLFGGGYEDVSKRLPNDALIKRLLLKFPADKSYEELGKALKEQDYETHSGQHIL